MKVLSYIACFCLLIVNCFAQSPQAFNYQAAVYDASGNPVSNQNISLRISVLDNAFNGPVLYSETFAATTDPTGFFAVQIGTGTVVSGTFATIKWQIGTKWQKTEIDTTGGTSFVLMGTSQYLSVPYSLYANESNRGSLEFPDGIENITPVVIQAGTYSVPLGKNFYINNLDGAICLFGSDTIRFKEVQSTGFQRIPVAASENTIVTALGTIVGFLVDKRVTWISVHVDITPYTVPAGKQFVVRRTFGYGNNVMTLNGISIPVPNYEFFIADENQTIAVSAGSALYMVGYLKDK